jgi:DNA-binding GntR family transcriptional regulator
MDDVTVTVIHNSPVPLYHQIVDQLEGAIDDGRLEKGAFLPNENKLAEMWGVSRPTVRQGIQELVNRGMLVRRRGIGTQVVASQVKRRAQLTSLWDQLVASGLRPSCGVWRPSQPRKRWRGHWTSKQAPRSRRWNGCDWPGLSRWRS